MKKYKDDVLIIGLVLFHMVKSMAWYSMFAEPWLEMSGITEIQAKNVNPIAYFTAMLSAGAAGYALLWLYKKLQINTAVKGATFALLLGLAFFLTELVTEDMFSTRQVSLSLINGGNFLIYLIVAGAVLGGWRRR